MKRDLPASEHWSAHAVADAMPSPAALLASLPASDAALRTVQQGRSHIRRILAGADPRLLVIVGPCSIHDPVAALDYAQRLRQLAEELHERLYLVMRVYFEKPRTRLGWKGLINDPGLDGSYRIAEGMHSARRLLLAINELGLPAASEALDPLSPPYLADLISWMAIGARTTESQTHREMASNLPMPVGFKNGTDGSIDIATHAIEAAARAHAFLGPDTAGRISIVRSPGNADGHLVLRGGAGGPNYDAASVAQALAALQAAQLPRRLIIDCAHANAGKRAEQQALVLADIAQQRRAGNRAIVGVMLESFVHGGNQPLPADTRTLRYGVSITDPCLSWEATEAALRTLDCRLR
ncbi:3-deoxy-7-phosphoheptulonate synthase [Chitinimonas sp.]|uniref:3-deoxy-7-phosphoheptulonate synthase n=1 Tax=Chitinimonas sp. TaxID=1934313 RepID=UPI0035AF20BA